MQACFYNGDYLFFFFRCYFVPAAFFVSPLIPYRVLKLVPGLLTSHLLASSVHCSDDSFEAISSMRRFRFLSKSLAELRRAREFLPRIEINEIILGSLYIFIILYFKILTPPNKKSVCLKLFNFYNLSFSLIEQCMGFWGFGVLGFWGGKNLKI